MHRLLESAMVELRDQGMEKSKIPEAARARVAKELKKLESRLKKVAHLAAPVKVDEGRRNRPLPAPKRRSDKAEKQTKTKKKTKRVSKKKVKKRDEVEDLQDIFDLLEMGE